MIFLDHGVVKLLNFVYRLADEYLDWAAGGSGSEGPGDQGEQVKAQKRRSTNKALGE